MNHLTYKLIGVSVAVWTLYGCAVTLPASEGIMFKGPQQETAESKSLWNDWYQKPTPKSDRSFGGMLMVTGHPVIKGEEAYVDAKFQEADGMASVFNPPALTFATSFRLLEAEHTAVHLQLGFPVLGVDVTTRLFDKTYLTANVGIATGELIIQRKLLDRKDIGLAVGPFYRAKRRYVLLPEGLSFLSLAIPQETFYNHHLGLRSVVYLPLDKKTYLHFFLSPAYVTNLKAFTVNMGMALHVSF